MSPFWVIVGGIGVICALVSLIGVGIAAATEKHWGTAMACLAAFGVILFLLLAGIEYSDNFWEGK
jgi:hypothetical protein